MARWIWFAGITALLVIGYFATFYERGQAQWRSVRFVEGELHAQAKSALARLGATWAQVKMDGQIAIVTGEAPTEADREDVKREIRAAAGPGGPWLGGITQVRDQMKVAAPVKPYFWTAVRGADGRVSLSGYVPGQRFRKAINAEARKLFPTGVDDQTIVAAGHPTGPWAETAIWGLRQLSQLQSGDARFTDAVITVRGQARQADVQAAIYASAKAVARPYQGVAEVTLSTAVALPEAPEETGAPPPELPAVQRLPAADCQKLIDQAMSDNVVSFSSGSAGVKASGNRVLDRIAKMAVDCSTLRFRITGHADGSSLENGLGDLSDQRAEAVADYLEAKGVARERLMTAGAGTSQPAGDNGTREGQARNRRVEITVLP
jgi:outer membrane protein OmpA-like peptidoglycan-associated protein